MSIADTIVAKLVNVEAVSLRAGYAAKSNGSRAIFPTATIQNETRDKSGRVTRTTAVYADGSKILYTWSYQAGPRWTILNPNQDK